MTSVELSYSTKIKSMIRTVSILTGNIIEANSDCTIDTTYIYEGLTDQFCDFYEMILRERFKEYNGKSRLIYLYQEYINECLINFSKGENQQKTFDCQIDIFSHVIETSNNEKQALLIVSNAISSCILSGIKIAELNHNRIVANNIAEAVVKKMGVYSLKSLSKYILNSGDSDIVKIFKIFEWTFVNGNPEMKITSDWVSEKEFTIRQYGECRQWINSEVTKCRENIDWPVNYSFFKESAKHLNPNIEVILTKMQCQGDSFCEFNCKYKND